MVLMLWFEPIMHAPSGEFFSHVTSKHPVHLHGPAELAHDELHWKLSRQYTGYG